MTDMISTIRIFIAAVGPFGGYVARFDEGYRLCRRRRSAGWRHSCFDPFIVMRAD